MFEVRCHGCQNTFEVDERRVPRNGMTMRCPKCQTTFLVRRPETMAFGVPAVPEAGGAFKVPPPPGAVAPPPPPIPGRVPPPPPPPMALHRGGAPAGDASLPMPADLAAGLPVPRPSPTRQTAPGVPAAPAPSPFAPDLGDDLGAWSLDLPQEPDLPSVPSSAGLPGGAAGANARATLALGPAVPEARPNVVGRPSPRPVAPDEVGLPALSDIGLPALPGAALPAVPAAGLPSPAAGLPAPAAGLPTLAAGLPQTAAGLPQTAAGLPQTAAGLPQMAAGLPMNAAGLPMNSAGLPMNSAGLPMNAANLPMNSAELPRNPAELPRNPAELPRNPAELPRNPAELPRNAAELPRNPGELPSFEPDSTPGSSTIGGMKLGRIGLERKAFTLSADNDLPIPVQAGVALPAPVTRGRLGRNDEFEPDALAMTGRQTPMMGGDSFGIPQAPPPGDFADFDLGPASSSSAVSAYPPVSGPLGAAPPAPYGAGMESTMMAPAPSLPDYARPSDVGGEFTGLPSGGAATADGGAFGKLRSRLTQMGRADKAPAESRPRRAEKKADGREVPWRSVLLYGGLGLVGLVVVGGAALAGTEYGAFGKNYIDDQLHGPERHAAATRVIQYVDRRMEHDTYDYAVGGLRRLEEALQRVPKENDLKAYLAYASSMVTLRFGADPTRTGRARALLTELREAPPSTHHLALARAADALARGNAREALRLARTDPNGRDLATMAAAELNDNTQWLRFATTGRQRHPTARSRYLLARAFFSTGDIAGARRVAEEVLREEPRHPSARILLARILGQREVDRGRALTLLADLVGSGRNGQPSAASAQYASPSERADAFVVAGQVELARDHISVAQARFQRALELEPRSSAALVGIGSILYRQGNFTDAQARFRNAFSADRHNTDAVIGMAQAALALDQAVEAKNALEPAVRENPNDGRLHYWLGRALAATSDQRTLAQQEFREAIRLMPDNLDAYVALSELLTSMQRHDTADQVLVEARARVPDNAAIHRALANSRLARGDVEGAQAELRVALERDPDDVRAHFAMGDVYRRMARLDDASREFDTVARIDPNYPGLSLARGQLAEARGELPQALTTFREALAREPTNVDLINRVASTLIALGNYGDADQMLRSVVVDQPNNAESQYIMGRARLGAGNFADAVHYLDRAVELNPNRAEYKAYAAEAHRRTGDIVRAQQLAEQSIELDPSFPRGYWVRAEIRVHQGAAAEALADINRAVQLDRNFWEAYATWADIDDALGRQADAVRLLQLATSHDARHGEWFYNLGRLLSDMGRNGEARAAFQQVRSLGSGLNPTPTWFVQGTRRLADLERSTNPANARALYLEFLRMVPPNSQAYLDVQGILLDMNSGG